MQLNQNKNNKNWFSADIHINVQATAMFYYRCDYSDYRSRLILVRDCLRYVQYLTDCSRSTCDFWWEHNKIYWLNIRQSLWTMLFVLKIKKTALPNSNLVYAIDPWTSLLSHSHFSRVSQIVYIFSNATGTGNHFAIATFFFEYGFLVAFEFRALSGCISSVIIGRSLIFFSFWNFGQSSGHSLSKNSHLLRHMQYSYSYTYYAILLCTIFI